MDIGVSGSSSFGMSSGAASQSANNQKFSEMFADKLLGKKDLTGPVLLTGLAALGLLALKKKLGF